MAQTVWEETKQAVATHIEAHPHAVVYGIVGFIAAALILLVGFWPTVLLALFAAIGAVIGRYRDGDSRTRQVAQRLINRMS